jgi:hypothetical protein
MRTVKDKCLLPCPRSQDNQSSDANVTVYPQNQGLSVFYITHGPSIHGVGVEGAQGSSYISLVLQLCRRLKSLALLLLVRCCEHIQQPLLLLCEYIRIIYNLIAMLPLHVLMKLKWVTECKTLQCVEKKAL